MCCQRPRLYRSSIRRVLVEGIVNSFLMMIGDVIANDSAQMGFIQRNDVIENLATAASDPAFGSSILPGRLDPSSFYFQPRRFQEIRNPSIKFRVVVENDIAAAHRVRKGLAKLLQRPLSGRLTGHVEVQDLASTMVDNKQTVQKLERDGWDREEIECDDHLTVVLKEGQPVLRGIPTPADASKITRNRPLAQNKSEFQQFALDFGRSPAGILLCHATNERAEFVSDSRSARPTARSPAPMQTEGRPMPAYDCIWLHNHEHPFPTGQRRRKAIQNRRSWAFKGGRWRFRSRTATC